jgi:hypothetical protein
VPLSLNIFFFDIVVRNRIDEIFCSKFYFGVKISKGSIFGDSSLLLKRFCR